MAANGRSEAPLATSAVIIVFSSRPIIIFETLLYLPSGMLPVIDVPTGSYVTGLFPINGN